MPETTSDWIVERFCQKLHCVGSHRLHPHFRVAACGYKVSVKQTPAQSYFGM
jgi:hypothetical protein